ncbi:L-selectin-like [Hemibagrus wyckioides]|uniref:L-selectin-like n=1 Tax=Hemibagrus wyckioides TaxID=337641 RepID=UPI00266D03DA|nr:L-selectin-like [Hemibagrus wyckioides]
MKSLFICQLLLLYGTAVGLVREYIYVSQQMNWTTAQAYCRYLYRDIASITTEEENQRAVNITEDNTILTWIGLKRTEPLADTWQWSGQEEPNFLNWRDSEPNGKNQDENCAAINAYGWIDDKCWINRPSICNRRFTLVKENKTWEEAFKYCRSHYYYLAIVDSQTLLDLLKTETKQAETASVWTGLRFLDGKWFWVDGMPVRSLVSMPQCPSRPYHCGAFNFNTYTWENRYCNEKLNFLCYY